MKSWWGFRSLRWKTVTSVVWGSSSLGIVGRILVHTRQRLSGVWVQAEVWFVYFRRNGNLFIHYPLWWSADSVGDGLRIDS